MNAVPPRILAELVCPVCRGELTELSDALGCSACRLRYPVVGSVPYLVRELAKTWRTD